MNNNTYGYIILRKPEYSFDVSGCGVFPRKALTVGNIMYSGIGRMAWFDLDEEYYSGVLPKELDSLICEIIGYDFTGIDIIGDLNNAKRILEHLNEKESRNEICMILNKDPDKYTYSIDGENAVWLGKDVYCPGYGSLLQQGIFVREDIFSEFTGKINCNGLFYEQNDIDEYIKKYVKICKRNNLEVIDESINKIITISMGRLI